jgi:hypothetical protein
MSQQIRISRARAAGMASATAGRARVFADRKRGFNTSDDEIAEAIAERDAQRMKDSQQMMADYSGLS